MWPWIQVLAYRSEATGHQKRLFEKAPFFKEATLRSACVCNCCQNAIKVLALKELVAYYKNM